LGVFYTSTEFWDVLSKKLMINLKQDLALNSVEDKACYNDYVLNTFSDSLKKEIYKISDSLYAKDCELIYKIAQQEVNNNQYFLYEFIDYPSSNAFWKKLEKYGIYKKESKNKFLKRNVDWCYNEFMGSKIQEKFGKDFLKNKSSSKIQE
jgi:hypothetical protein